ncbi:hypothetical protein PFISCL1PPCAC_13942, partial [Pristionchus fissidentatus]
FAVLYIATPRILNVSTTTKICLGGIMVGALVCAVLSLIGIRTGAPKLLKPIIILNVIVQALLLLQIFYAIAAILFPDLPIPAVVKDTIREFEFRLDSVENKITNIMQSIAAAVLLIDIVLYAISLRVLIIHVKCFYIIKAKRYQPVPVYHIPPLSMRPLVVVKTDEVTTDGQTQPAVPDAQPELSGNSPNVKSEDALENS